MSDPVHLATGILCGGKPTYCGESLETEYREDTGKTHVLNATQDPGKATCSECSESYTKLLQAALR